MPSRLSYALALASGALLALSFPKFGHAAVGWIALAPLLVALSSATLRRAFVLGLLTGVVYFAGTLYWITDVMVMYGDLPRWVAGLAERGAHPVPRALSRDLRAGRAPHRDRARSGRLMTAPIVWVATELGRTYIFPGGFPWVLLGYSQTTVLPIAQFASVFGVYGVSMLVASVSAACATAFLRPPETGHDPSTSVRSSGIFAGSRASLVCVIIAVLAIAAWGSRRVAVAEWTHAGDPIRVGLDAGQHRSGGEDGSPAAPPPSSRTTWA